MKIYINGKKLDTYTKSVSVKKTNNLWKFGKAEFERTQTISVPATNNNKALLDFADEFRTQSSVARGYVDCLTELDGVVKPARLYVSGYKGGEFSCILTFGKELQSLDVKLSDYLGEIEDFNTVLGLTKNFKELNLYDKDGKGIKRFCVLFSYILGLLNSKGVSLIDYNAFNFSSLGYAVDYNSTNIGEVGGTKAVVLSREYTQKSTSSANKTPLYNYSFDYAFLNKYKKLTNYTLLMSIEYQGQTVHNSYYAPLQYYQFPFDIVLRFGDDCSDYALGFVGSGTTYNDAFSSLRGHYRGDGWIEVSDDLSNTDVTIPANTKFVLLKYNDFYDSTILSPTVPGEFWSVRGLYYADYGGVANTFTNISVVLPVFNYNFIPDITVYKLLQTLAAYKGKLLYFDGSKYTLASVYDITSSAHKEFKYDIIAADSYEVSDKSFDFAQHNLLKYKSGGIELDYKVNNVHLSETKDILSIPFDGGNFETGGSTIFRLVDKLPAIGAIQGSYFRFSQISKIGGFEAFITNTRQVKVKFRMTYLDFVGIKELDNFEYKGATLQWSSIQWSDGWCTATLQTLQ